MLHKIESLLIFLTTIGFTSNAVNRIFNLDIESNGFEVLRGKGNGACMATCVQNKCKNIASKAMDCTEDEVLTNRVNNDDHTNLNLIIKSISDFQNIVIEIIIDSYELNDYVILKVSYNSQILIEEMLYNIRFSQKYIFRNELRIANNHDIKLEIFVPRGYKVTINSISINAVVHVPEIDRKEDVTNTVIKQTLESFKKNYGKKLNNNEICDSECKDDDKVKKCMVGSEKVECENKNGWLIGTKDNFESLKFQTKQWIKNDLLIIELHCLVHFSGIYSYMEISGYDLDTSRLFSTYPLKINIPKKFNHSYLFLNNKQIYLEIHVYKCIVEIIDLRVFKMKIDGSKQIVLGNTKIIVEKGGSPSGNNNDASAPSVQNGGSTTGNDNDASAPSVQNGGSPTPNDNDASAPSVQNGGSPTSNDKDASAPSVQNDANDNNAKTSNQSDNPKTSKKHQNLYFILLIVPVIMIILGFVFYKKPKIIKSFKISYKRGSSV